MDFLGQPAPTGPDESDRRRLGERPVQQGEGIRESRMNLRSVFPTLIALLLSVAGTASAGAADKVKVVALQGTQLFVVKAMQSRGIAAKHGIEMDVMEVASPQASYTAMQTGEPNIGFTGWVVIASLREKGFKLTNVYSVVSFTNDVMVKEGSPIKTLADLKGKRVGLFGGPNSATTWLYRMMVQKFHGYDPMKDSKIHFGAPPLLMGMLDRGDLDALLALDPFISRMLESGQYRSIADLGKIWREKTGQNPLLVTVTVNEDWAKANRDVTRRFILAFREALTYLKTTPEAWTPLAREMGLKTDRGAKILYQRTAEAYVTRWDKKVVDEQLAYAAELYKTFGKHPDIPERVPAGTFDLSYAP
jgi:NitT/TauT family transport system substrate-binding protein